MVISIQKTGTENLLGKEKEWPQGNRPANYVGFGLSSDGVGQCKIRSRYGEGTIKWVIYSFSENPRHSVLLALCLRKYV